MSAQPMDDQALKSALEAMIPKGLDDIIRANRDKASLRLASDQEIMQLYRPVRAGEAKGRMENWCLIALEVAETGEVQVMLLGDRHDGRGPRITSLVETVDLDRGYVVTQNSLYALGQRGEGEPPFEHLAMICAAFHGWGFGRLLGVPHFFY